jgi:hypothetical protein
MAKVEGEQTALSTIGIYSNTRDALREDRLDNTHIGKDFHGAGLKANGT